MGPKSHDRGDLLTGPESHDIREDPSMGPESHNKWNPLTNLESHDLGDPSIDPTLGMPFANLNFQASGNVLANLDSLAMEDPSANPDS